MMRTCQKDTEITPNGHPLVNLSYSIKIHNDRKGLQSTEWIATDTFILL